MLFLFRTLVSWRRFILVSGLVVALVTAGVSLILPKWYTASTTIFPPETTGTAGLYAQIVESIAMPMIGQLGTGTAPETIYIDMLKSRTICEQVIEEFDLMEVYGHNLIEFALEEFQSHCGYTLLINGLIVMTYEDRDPERAAAVANRMIELLNEFNTNMSMSRASRTRNFVETQLGERENELAAAETALRDFQRENEALELTEQLHSAMEIVSTLTAKAIALESELEILGYYTSQTSEEYVRKQNEYKQAIRQLEKLKRGGDDDEDMVRAYIPTLDEVPELALEMMRLKRDVEIESTVYTMLLKEYEKARIEEARDTPTVQILDRASVPNLRSRPKRKSLVIFGGVAGIGWAVVVALFVSAWRENREGSHVWRDVLGPVANDVSRVFRRRKRS